MPPKQRYYDPQIQPMNLVAADGPPGPSGPEVEGTSPIHAIVAEQPGVYLLVDHVAQALLEFAAAEPSEIARDAVERSVAWLTQGISDASPGTTPLPTIPFADPVLDPRASRIEVYPDAEGRWYHRTVDDQGAILQVSRGDLNHDYVIEEARQVHPGLEIFELQEEMSDSLWTGFGPSPRRLWRNN